MAELDEGHRYYLNLRYQGRLFADPEGDQLADVGAACTHAREVAADLIADARLRTIRSWFDCVFEITDDDGQLVAEVAFDDVGRRPAV